jgi:hypothetical protein
VGAVRRSLCPRGGEMMVKQVDDSAIPVRSPGVMFPAVTLISLPIHASIHASPNKASVTRGRPRHFLALDFHRLASAMSASPQGSNNPQIHMTDSWRSFSLALCIQCEESFPQSYDIYADHRVGYGRRGRPDKLQDRGTSPSRAHWRSGR